MRDEPRQWPQLCGTAGSHVSKDASSAGGRENGAQRQGIRMELRRRSGLAGCLSCPCSSLAGCSPSPWHTCARGVELLICPRIPDRPEANLSNERAQIQSAESSLGVGGHSHEPSTTTALSQHTCRHGKHPLLPSPPPPRQIAPGRTVTYRGSGGGRGAVAVGCCTFQLPAPVFHAATQSRGGRGSEGGN